MKKILASFVTFCVSIIILTPMTIPVYAEDISTVNTHNDTVRYTVMSADGSYDIIEIEENSARSSKTAKKTQSHYSTDDVLEWKVVLQGTFTYNGTTSSCTNASHTITIYNNSWFTYSQNSYASGNKAIANVVMKLRVLGVIASTNNVHLQLSCDKNGNIS